MPWICEFCGRENLQDERVGRNEPACIRCGHRRGERATAIKELQATITRLEEDRAYSATIRHYKGRHRRLWTELHGFADKHDQAVRSSKNIILQESSGCKPEKYQPRHPAIPRPAHTSGGGGDPAIRTKASPRTRTVIRPATLCWTMPDERRNAGGGF